MVQLIFVLKKGYLSRLIIKISSVNCYLNFVFVWVDVIKWFFFIVVVVISMFGLRSFNSVVKWVNNDVLVEYNKVIFRWV